MQKWRFLKLLLIVFVVITAVLFLTSLGSKEEYINKISVNANNEQTVVQADLLFRQRIIDRYKAFSSIDSLARTIKATGDDSANFVAVIKQFNLAAFADLIKDSSLRVKGTLSWQDYSLFAFDSIPIAIKLDKQKFLNILGSARNADEAGKLILFGNYIIHERPFKMRLNTAALLVIALISILVASLISYMMSNPEIFGNKVVKSSEPVLLIQTKLNDLPGPEKPEERNKAIDDIITQIKFSFDYQEAEASSPTAVLLDKDYKEFTAKAEAMYERSSIFLLFAFAISIFGILIFYILIPEYNKSALTFVEYLGVSLRPFLILTFFQTLAFYLLKQYKGSINDYKFFYQEARNRKRFLMAYDILSKKDEPKAGHLIGMHLLRDKGVLPAETPGESNEEGEKGGNGLEALLKLLEAAKEKP